MAYLCLLALLVLSGEFSDQVILSFLDFQCFIILTRLFTEKIDKQGDVKFIDGLIYESVQVNPTVDIN